MNFDILRLIVEALSLAEEIVRTVDQPGGGAALLLALLWERDQKVLYVPGLTVDRVRDAYHEESRLGSYKGMVPKGRSLESWTPSLTMFSDCRG
jgi:hypothetical protein